MFIYFNWVKNLRSFLTIVRRFSNLCVHFISSFEAKYVWLFLRGVVQYDLFALWIENKWTCIFCHQRIIEQWNETLSIWWCPKPYKTSKYVNHIFIHFKLTKFIFDNITNSPFDPLIQVLLYSLNNRQKQ